MSAIKAKPKQSQIDKLQSAKLARQLVDDNNDAAISGISMVTGAIDSRKLSGFDFVKECKRRSPAALQTISNMMLRGNDAQRIRCAEIILAYAHGKPVDTTLNVNSQVKPADIAKLIDARRAARKDRVVPTGDFTQDQPIVDTTGDSVIDV